MKQTEVINLLESLGIFSEVENVFEPDEEILGDEKILGDANQLEKECLTFLAMQDKKHDKIIEDLKGAISGGNQKELEKLKADHEKFHKAVEMVRLIMWTSVQTRLQTSEDATGLAIKKGFKVVETQRQKPSGPDFLFPGMFGGMFGVRVPR